MIAIPKAALIVALAVMGAVASKEGQSTKNLASFVWGIVSVVCHMLIGALIVTLLVGGP